MTFHTPTTTILSWHVRLPEPGHVENDQTKPDPDQGEPKTGGYGW